MRLLEFVNEARFVTVVPLPDTSWTVRGDGQLVIWRRDGSYFVVDPADTVYLSEN